MKRKRHTPEQIVGHLRGAEAMASEGLGIAEICKKNSMRSTRLRYAACPS